MTTYPGFESVDHLKRSLVSFDVSTKKFIMVVYPFFMMQKEESFILMQKIHIV